ncbi:MAG TPA: hypothetical protein VF120_17720, partial [Ktedonobacterales bacterium]
REIVPWIQSRGITGYRGMQVCRRAHGDTTEFMTIMWFDSMDGVRAFAGDDVEAAVVPPSAQELLVRFDARSQHYTVQVDATPHGRLAT